MTIAPDFATGVRPSDGVVALALILAVINRGNLGHQAECLRAALSLFPKNCVGVLADARGRVDAMVKAAEAAGTPL